MKISLGLSERTRSAIRSAFAVAVGIIVIVGGVVLSIDFFPEDPWLGLLLLLISIAFGALSVSAAILEWVGKRAARTRRERAAWQAKWSNVILLLSVALIFLVVLLVFRGSGRAEFCSTAFLIVMVLFALSSLISRVLIRRTRAKDTTRDSAEAEEEGQPTATPGPLPGKPARPFAVTIFDAENLPAPSKTAREYLERGRRRFQESARIFRRPTWFLMLGNLGLGAASLVLLDPSRVPCSICGWLTVGTLLYLLLLNPERILALYSIGIPMIFSFAWMGYTLYNAGYCLWTAGTRFPDGLPQVPFWLGLLGGALFVLAVIWMLRGGVELRRKRQADPSAKLLFLWVFGSDKRVFALINYVGTIWRNLGSVQFLRGEGYIADDAVRIVFKFLRGERQVVQTQEELSATLEAFEHAPRALGYTANTLLCHDSIWQQAFEILLGNTDLILMDLCGFSDESRGCVYELGRLIDCMPTGRFLLLTNEETNMEFLLGLLRDEWDTMAQDSPNQQTTGIPLQIYRLQEAAPSSEDRGFDYREIRFRASEGERIAQILAEGMAL